MSDAVDSLVNEVARNEIWREHIKKENSILEDTHNRSSFRLNVKRLKEGVLATKPEKMPAPGTAKKDGSMKLSLDKSSQDQLFGVMPPITAQKSGVPSTASQEYGWLLNRRCHSSIAAFRQRWAKGKTTCDVTQYADSFATMTKNSPFSARAQRGMAGGGS